MENLQTLAGLIIGIIIYRLLKGLVLKIKKKINRAGQPENKN
jgi:uncharacterized membrane-anchored protein YhcB (DUF1043 family)